MTSDHHFHSIAVAGLVSVIVVASACGRDRQIKLSWDAPAAMPAGYRIFVDDRPALNIPPPPIDPSCNCLSATVDVPPGQHTIKVVAYNQNGDSPASMVTVVK